MDKYVVLDIESTGTKPTESEIIEIGALYIQDNQIVKKFNTFVKPTQSIPSYVTNITGIQDEWVKFAPDISKVLPKFISFCEDAVLVGHNITLFDYRILKANAIKLNLDFNFKIIDTLLIARSGLKHLESRKLGDLCTFYNINLTNAHRAYSDALATYYLLLNLHKDFGEDNPDLFIPKQVNWKIPKPK
ncbi:hypothetical protein AN639_07590 [Candidatus Epulonipiscium fishelsonii]|uniref:Uncharacterized protein n=1 Tax=Candidatus Epulonipiscium fishelsonii TaxID=77094 RepID=A0ACC8XFG8_9FIRM|nr:hypothetical protein AN639_07590 [Epulopiscium sp. SCG-B05WGA-EpuloA1]ONI42049.1 hypothetical protein AN396_00315 [Epulopiscium sp. SCG-B11WGA-EpuloA1]